MADTKISDAPVAAASMDRLLDDAEVPKSAPAGITLLPGLPCCACVETGSIGVKTVMGQFTGYVVSCTVWPPPPLPSVPMLTTPPQEPGCVCLCVPWDDLRHVSLALQAATCSSDCKTKDNVTVTVKVRPRVSPSTTLAHPTLP